MKRIFFILILSFVVILSCKKTNEQVCSDVTITAPATEVAALRTYIEVNAITATEDARGFFYTITSAGSGSKPSSCAGVTVNYVGKLTNGVTFDSGNGVSFYLSRLITGWQEGIPLIAPGGSITLYLPPSLAYGAAGSGPIPPNANLIFTIDLSAIY